MTILLTGADGFIGSHILKKLNEYNIEIIAFIYNYNEFIIKSQKYENVIFIKVNLNTKYNLKQILNNYHIDAVIHCAYVSKYSNNNELYTNVLNVNLIATYKLIQYAIENNIKKFFYISSAGIYKDQTKNKKNNEKDDISINSVYFICKRQIETVIEYFDKVFDTQFVIFRIGTIYSSVEIPSKYRPNISLLTSIISKLKKNEVININNYNIYRDYCHIDNITYVIHEFLKTDEYKFLIYNLGSEDVYTIIKILTILKKKNTNIQLNKVTDEKADIVLDTNNNRAGLNMNRVKEVVSNYPLYTFKQSLIYTYNHL
jgi:nucleoside-diphosphate-sugar epimerase